MISEKAAAELAGELASIPPATTEEPTWTIAAAAVLLHRDLDRIATALETLTGCVEPADDWGPAQLRTKVSGEISNYPTGP